MKPFGKRVRDLRKENGLTQEQLADILKNNSVNLSAWENDRYEPDMKTIVMIAKYFNVSADYLLGIED